MKEAMCSPSDEQHSFLTVTHAETTRHADISGFLTLGFTTVICPTVFVQYSALIKVFVLSEHITKIVQWCNEISAYTLGENGRVSRLEHVL